MMFRIGDGGFFHEEHCHLSLSVFSYLTLTYYKDFSTLLHISELAIENTLLLKEIFLTRNSKLRQGIGMCLYYMEIKSE
jgi:hypothetical protein